MEQGVPETSQFFCSASFALENAIKAFLVYENPHWISTVSFPAS